MVDEAGGVQGGNLAGVPHYPLTPRLAPRRGDLGVDLYEQDLVAGPMKVSREIAADVAGPRYNNFHPARAPLRDVRQVVQRSFGHRHVKDVTSWPTTPGLGRWDLPARESATILRRPFTSKSSNPYPTQLGGKSPLHHHHFACWAHPVGRCRALAGASA